MALLFLDDAKEASRFSSSTGEAFVRIAPNHDSKNSAIWGIENRCMYFGYGQDDEHVVDKVLFIHDGCIGIGTANPRAKCEIFADDLQTVLNVQNALLIYQSGAVQIGASSNSSLCVTCDAMFHGKTDLRNDLKISNELTSIRSKQMDIGTDDSTTSWRGALNINGPLRILRGLDVYSPVCMKKDLSLYGNLYMVSDGYADSWTLKNTLSTKSIDAKKITCNGEGLAVTGGNILLDGNISIGLGRTTSSTESVYVSKDMEISPGRKIGLGKKPNASIDTTGDIHVEGALTVFKGISIGDSLSLQHRVLGNLFVEGRQHTWKGDQLLQGDISITNNCYIGQEHCPGLLHVYGPVHVKEMLYSHQTMYADKDIQLRGQLIFQSDVSPSRVLLHMPSGSINMMNGRLHINASSPCQDTLFVKGDSVFDGPIITKENVSVMGHLQVTKSVTVKENACFENNLEVSCNASVKKTLSVSEDISVRQNIHAKQEVHVGTNLYVGTQEKGLLSINGQLKTNDSIETPLTRTGNIVIDSAFKYRNRRFGVRNTPTDDACLMKLVHIPYRRGNTAFFIRITGVLHNHVSTLYTTVELGGNIENPTHKISTTSGQLHDAYKNDISKYVGYHFYRTPSQDIIGCMRTPTGMVIGYELDFEIDSRIDIFNYTQMDLNSHRSDGWTLWWDVLATAQIGITKDAIHFQRRIGVAEQNPLYMLDVRPDARFQGDIYQPVTSDFILPSDIPYVQHDDKKYYAISDVLGWLVRSVHKLQQSNV